MSKEEGQENLCFKVKLEVPLFGFLALGSFVKLRLLLAEAAQCG